MLKNYGQMLEDEKYNTIVITIMLKNYYGQMLEDEKYQREAFQTLLLRQDDRATEIQVKSI